MDVASFLNNKFTIDNYCIVKSEIVDLHQSLVPLVIDINLTLNRHIQANEQHIIQDRRRFGVKYFHFTSLTLTL